MPEEEDELLLDGELLLEEEDEVVLDEGLLEDEDELDDELLWTNSSWKDLGLTGEEKAGPGLGKPTHGAEKLAYAPRPASS